MSGQLLGCVGWQVADMAIPVSRCSVFAAGLDHPECLAVHPDGTVFAGGEAGQIYRISADGKRVEEVGNTGGFVLGVAVHPDGRRLAVCDLKKRAVFAFEIATGELSELSRGAPGAAFSIPNHLSYAPDGTLYVTDSGHFREVDGRVLRVSPEGETTVWHPGPINFANGTALAREGDALFVVSTWLPGVVRIPIRADGSAGRVSTYVRLPKALPDGCCFDARGNLYVSCYTPARIYKVSPARKVSVLVDDWEAHTLANPTNVAFGGAKMDELLAANLGRWHITRIPVRAKGLPLAGQRGNGRVTS